MKNCIYFLVNSNGKYDRITVWYAGNQCHKPAAAGYDNWKQEEITRWQESVLINRQTLIIMRCIVSAGNGRWSFYMKSIPLEG